MPAPTATNDRNTRPVPTNLRLLMAFFRINQTQLSAILPTKPNSFTAHRWLEGTSTPTRRNQTVIEETFHLPPNSLSQPTPLFLLDLARYQPPPENNN